MLQFHCRTCGLAITNVLVELSDPQRLSGEPEEDRIPVGNFFKLESIPQDLTAGSWIVNLKDLVNVENHNDMDR